MKHRYIEVGILWANGLSKFANHLPMNDDILGENTLMTAASRYDKIDKASD